MKTDLMNRNHFIASSIIISVIICCAGFTPAGTRQGGGTAASVAKGKIVYSVSCLPCHQADGGGVPNLNPPLIKTKQVLGDKKQLINIVLNGLSGEIEVDGETYHNVMPPQNSLTDQQIADVLTYVRNSFKNKAVAVKASEVKAQRALMPKAN